METSVLDNEVGSNGETQSTAVQTVTELTANELALVGGGTANVSWL